MNAKRLWTGETPRQYLVARLATLTALGAKVTDAIETALDGAEDCPDGSPNREALRWFESIRTSPTGWARLVADVRKVNR